MAESNSITLAARLERWRRRSAEAEARADRRRAEKPQPLFLPGFRIGTMPNHLNRSSLFAPVARGRRDFYRRQMMVTRRDCTLEYTGEQLDEADADIIMALIYFAQHCPIGEPVPLNRAELLCRLGRSTGKKQYEWLHRRITALTEATLFLEARQPDGSPRYRVGKTYAFHILTAFYYDAAEATYCFRLDPRWVDRFGNREYALLDWDARLQIRRAMAKTLQRLMATSTDPVRRFALDRLKAQMVYKSPMRKFRQALMAAVAELKRLAVIADGRIETGTKGTPQLVLHRPQRVQIKQGGAAFMADRPPPAWH